MTVLKIFKQTSLFITTGILLMSCSGSKSTPSPHTPSSSPQTARTTPIVIPSTPAELHGEWFINLMYTVNLSTQEQTLIAPNLGGIEFLQHLFSNGGHSYWNVDVQSNQITFLRENEQENRTYNTEWNSDLETLTVRSTPEARFKLERCDTDEGIERLCLTLQEGADSNRLLVYQRIAS